MLPTTGMTSPADDTAVVGEEDVTDSRDDAAADPVADAGGERAGLGWSFVAVDEP